MPPSIDIDALITKIDQARKDETLPAWVSVLLETVLLLVTTMQMQFALMQTQLELKDAQIAKFQKQIYGRSSERKPPKKAEPSATPKRSRTPRTGPSALDLAELDEEVAEHPVPEAEQTCSVCGGHEFTELPAEESVVYTYKPARLVRVRHRRQKCACRNGCSVVTAPAPPKVVEGGRFSSSLYADIVTKRSFDAIPFNRQADAFKRAGVPLSASTICDLFHSSADVLSPVYKALLEEIRAAKVVHADETPQPVLDDGGTSRSYVWTFSTPKLAAYVHSSRSGATPKRILEDSAGVLVVDGYAGYNTVTTPEGRTRAGCMAHARRKFVEAECQAQDEVRWLLEQISQIYAVEKKATEAGLTATDEHLAMRIRESKPIMDEIQKWISEQQLEARPKSNYGKALTYIEKQWDSLTVFLTDPEVPPDNNLAERMLRRIALARKSSFFVGDNASGQRYAINMSFVASCRLNKINPAEYLTDVLTRIADYPASRVAELLPDRWVPTQV